MVVIPSVDQILGLLYASSDETLYSIGSENRI